MRSSPPSRSGSGDSSKSAGGSARDHELSVNFYSKENGHWATFTRQQGADVGTIQHVRSNTDQDQDRFYYHEAPQKTASPSLYGKSVVGRLSAGETAKAQASIRAYAGHDDNIPRVSRQQNCQSFVTGALGHLEQDKLIKPGNSRYFARHHGHRGQDIGDQLRRDGRHFEQADSGAAGVRAAAAPQGPPAARFGDKSTRPPPRKLNMAAFANLSQ